MRLFWTIFAAVIAFIPGCIGGAMVTMSKPLKGSHFVPLPHHIPTSPNVTSFRFAMVHDVLHERFAKHSTTYYVERERRAKERLATIPDDSDEAFGLYDDIGVGLERQGKPADAIPILRKKLDLQLKRKLSGRELYTTYANLGTFLAHANMPKAIAGDAAAKKAVEEGLDFVKKSVEANPEAHFGREVWQIILAKFLFAAIEIPAFLTQYDFIGDELGVTWQSLREKNSKPFKCGKIADDFGRANFGFESSDLPFGTGRCLIECESRPEKIPEQWEYVKKVRLYIAKVGAAKSWTGSSISDKYMTDDCGDKVYGVAFDEPMLGIIGMWRRGGGANPHFTLCVGEVMLRVGQRRMAWAAFERTKQLSSKFWPKPVLQQAIRDHCEKRQKEIAESLPEAEVSMLRKNFDDELEYGLNYQREYQQFESDKIAAGADIGDEHFFDDFNRTHPPIASPSGPEEWYAYQLPDYGSTIFLMFGGAMLISGIIAFLTSYLLYRRAKSKALRSMTQFGVFHDE